MRYIYATLLLLLVLQLGGCKHKPAPADDPTRTFPAGVENYAALDGQTASAAIDIVAEGFLGDLNHDGKWTNPDLVICQEIAVGMPTTAWQYWIADMDQNGVVNQKDVNALRKKVKTR